MVRWNPLGAGGTSRVNNFGDLLGPRIVERLSGVKSDHVERRSLLSVGSVMQFAEPGDVVWGSGVNAKLRLRRSNPDRIFDVRAVRGLLSGLALASDGNAVPDVWGDPALLLPRLFPETTEWASAAHKRRAAVVVPNVNDLDAASTPHPLVSPTGAPWEVIRELLASEIVVGSSLHAIIVAEAYGIPARAVRSQTESLVKYVDYYSGTGRHGVEIADSIEHALALGGAPLPPADGTDALLAAFPIDLWEQRPDVAPSRVASRPIGDVAEEIRDRALQATGTDREAWSVLAQRTVLPVLRDRAHAVDRTELERVVEAARELVDAALLPAPDERYEATRTLVDLHLTERIARASLENSSGYRAVLDSVARAGADGWLELSGTLQLPDARLRDYQLTMSIADDTFVERTELIGTRWVDESPSSGRVRWTCSVDVDKAPRGSWVLLVRVEGVGDGRDVIVKSAPPLAFQRWWTDHSSYRVDRTARGHVVVHLEEKEFAR